MKKIIYILIFALSFTAIAQEKIAEGIVISKQTMSSDNEQVNGQLAMIGDIITTTYFKNNMSRSESSNPMSGTTIGIMDNTSMKMMMIMDNMMVGKKYMISDFTPSEEDLKNIKVEKTQETKTLLGYECTKYNVEMTKSGATVLMELYATDKLSAISQQTTAFGKGFTGFPLYMKLDAEQGGMKMTIINEVTSVKAGIVSDDKFDMTPPEGYEKTESLPGM